MVNTSTTVRDLWRLSEEAARRGIRVYREAVSGEYYVTSASDPSKVYRATAYTCCCPGFVRHGRCTHYSALLATLGWLPDPEPPTPASPTLAGPADVESAFEPCPCCRGTGTDWAESRGGLQVGVACPICTGTGEVPAMPDDADEPAAPAEIASAAVISDVTGFRSCPNCFGEGVRHIHLGGRLSNWIADPCVTCRTTGRVAVAA